MKFKFNGILAKYVEGMKKKELKAITDELTKLQAETEQEAQSASACAKESVESTQGETSQQSQPIPRARVPDQRKIRIAELQQ